MHNEISTKTVPKKADKIVNSTFSQEHSIILCRIICRVCAVSVLVEWSFLGKKVRNFGNILFHCELQSKLANTLKMFALVIGLRVEWFELILFFIWDRSREKRDKVNEMFTLQRTILHCITPYSPPVS